MSIVAWQRQQNFSHSQELGQLALRAAVFGSAGSGAHNGNVTLPDLAGNDDGNRALAAITLTFRTNAFRVAYNFKQ